MAQIPANQKLWIMYVAQAKAKYRAWPSPTAAKWVHDHYVQAGGRFVSSEHEVDERLRDERYTKNRGEKGKARPNGKETEDEEKKKDVKSRKKR